MNLNAPLPKVFNRIIMAIGWIIILGFVAFVYASCKPVFQYGHLEKNARKIITGDELQAWATNLLAHYPIDTNFYRSQLGTNFPKELRGLAPATGPDIYVYTSDTNNPPFVKIAWGSGFLGSSGFCVGPTNFAYGNVADLTNSVSNIDGYYLHLWQPGVWFYRNP